MKKCMGFIIGVILAISMAGCSELKRAEGENLIITKNVSEDEWKKRIEVENIYNYMILGYKDGNIIGQEYKDVKIDVNTYETINSDEISILNEDGTMKKTKRKVKDEIDDFLYEGNEVIDLEEFNIPEDKKDSYRMLNGLDYKPRAEEIEGTERYLLYNYRFDEKMIIDKEKNKVYPLEEFDSENYIFSVDGENLFMITSKIIYEVKLKEGSYKINKLKDIDGEIKGELIGLDVVEGKVYVGAYPNKISGIIESEGIYRYDFKTNKYIKIYEKKDKNDSYKRVRNSEFIVISEGDDPKKVDSNYYLTKVVDDKLEVVYKIGSDKENNAYRMPEVYINEVEKNILVHNSAKESKNGKDISVFTVYDLK